MHRNDLTNRTWSSTGCSLMTLQTARSIRMEVRQSPASGLLATFTCSDKTVPLPRSKHVAQTKALCAFPEKAEGTGYT